MAVAGTRLSHAHFEPTAAGRRRVLSVACCAHALHDGYTDLIYVLLPVWQSEFALSYAALGALRMLYTGAMAGMQMPAAMLAGRLGAPLVLALGTALAAGAYLTIGLASAGFVLLAAVLLAGGAGSSTQHPLASALIAGCLHLASVVGSPHQRARTRKNARPDPPRPDPPRPDPPRPDHGGTVPQRHLGGWR